ncbi:hypothetical protein MCOR16_001532 [Pyricularia oryzae]|nr:hypothetical protein MCOR15_003676 [Pyricularia oryzae]KAI6538907.1 hypothetical protein MCOR16_001532 [Pyricularia oryzae]
MSVAYEPRNFIHDGSYPPIGDTHDMTDLQGVHEVHDVHESHSVHEAHEVHEHHEVHDTHDLPDVHDVHAVHELQAAQGVADVTDVTDLQDPHELHDPQNVHEVQHEVHEVHDVHDVHDVHELQADDGAQFDDADVVTELAAAVNGYHDHGPEQLMGEPEQRMVLVHGLPDVPEPPQMSPEMVVKEAESPQPTAAPRMKAIPKPARQATKNLTGKFICTWPNCNEEIREFSRKCEWNKHMDKHDRPYKCTAEGCEKLPGFTYSGGLLRHEREVHAKHGGPKNPLNCPHPTCKRHTGKGFSRQENLNEHLRRCHRNGSPSNAEGDTDDAASEAGVKRKRETEDDVAELRAEVKKQRLENDELRQKLDTQTQQIAAMMQQITDLQARDLMQ